MASYNAVQRLHDLYGVKSNRTYFDPFLDEVQDPSDIQLLLMHLRGYLVNEIHLRDIPTEEPDYAHPGKGLTTKLWKEWLHTDASFFLLRSDVTAVHACRLASLVYHRDGVYSFDEYVPILLRSVSETLGYLIRRPDVNSFSHEDLFRIFTPETLFQMYPISEVGGRRVSPGFVNMWWYLLGTITGDNYSHIYHSLPFSTFIHDTFAEIVQGSSLDNVNAALVVQNCVRILSTEESSNILYRANLSSYVKSMRAYKQYFRLPRIGKVLGVKLVVTTSDEIIVCTSYDKEYISPDDEPVPIPPDSGYRLRDQAEEILRSIGRF